MLHGSAAALLGCVFLCSMQAASVRSEYELKAAFLVNFTRFIDWPVRAGNLPDAFVLCVAGRDPFGSILDETIAGQRVEGRPIRLHRTADPASLRSCHAVFIAASEMYRLHTLLQALAGSSVLTVGEANGFAARGGMINFVTQEDRIRFEVNRAAVARARLTVSARLLQLAILVDPS